MLLTTRSYARAGLVGNPSDGYFGKTLSATFRNFYADVTMYETPELSFIHGEVDDAVFSSPDALLEEIRLFGYYGGIRLMKAVTKLFFEYCRERDIAVPRMNFTARYVSNIPRLVGLSGSSAICTAMLKALQQFYGVSVDEAYAPTLCLQAERDELGIQCGLQDRVIQMYGGLVFMDFQKALIERDGFGIYERLSPKLLPKLYIAYDPHRAEVSGIYHRKLRVLFEEKQPDVVEAMIEFAEYAQAGRDALVSGHPEKLAALMDANFDLRDRIFHVSDGNRAMVMTARKAGCSAKFAGSGGAIVGVYESDAQYDMLEKKMAEIGCATIHLELDF